MDDNILSLIQGCLANDRMRWSELLQTCTSIATRFHQARYSSLLTANDTNNILSNVVMKLFHGGLENFSGATKFELLSYIKKIIINETFSYLRQLQKRNRITSLYQGLVKEDDPVNSSLHDFLKDNKLGPDQICEINDLFKKAMAQLTIKEGQILLYKVQGYKDKEIAELLDMPMNTVASKYSRIKDLLKLTLLTILMFILFGRNLPWNTSL
ncbi:MAG: RNA polymerase sigma factor [Gammaproteobacteria bacterium]|nr:RNA polymerase sigma factor [Gammaproteobacteria bacterium]MDR3665693.1 RNA polymerase sigma factor [Ignavibacteriaceae bacterium]